MWVYTQDEQKYYENKRALDDDKTSNMALQLQHSSQHLAMQVCKMYPPQPTPLRKYHKGLQHAFVLTTSDKQHKPLLRHI